MKTQSNQVKERPIIFSGEMVRAILDGKKTMTRRLVKGDEKLAEIKAMLSKGKGA